MHLLEVPAVLAGLRFDGNDGRGEEVVAGAHGAVEVRARVAGGEIDQAELAIRRGCLPHRAAAALPRVGIRRPGVVPELARAGDGVERPQQLAVLRVVRLDAAADAELGAGEAGDHDAVEIERRGGEREAVLRAFGLHGPRSLAGAPVERDETTVERAEEHLVFAQGDAAIGPAAAHRRDLRIESGGPLPQDGAAHGIQREHVVGAGGEIDAAVVHQRLRRAGELRAEARAVQVRAPDALELRDVAAVDRFQRREPLVEELPPLVRQPSRGRAVRIRRKSHREAQPRVTQSPPGAVRRRRPRARAGIGQTFGIPSFRPRCTAAACR